MPKQAMTGRKRNGRRPYRKPKEQGLAIVALKSMPRSQFPMNVKASLRYTETVTQSLTAGLANDFLFNLNSLYDPNRTGGGHQPSGFDNWSGMYNRYRVDSLEISLTPLSTTSTTAITYTIVPNNQTNVMTQYYQGAEQGFAKQISFQNNGQRLSLNTHIDLYRITGVPLDKYITDDIYSAVTTGSPSETLILHCIAEDAAQAAITVYVQVNIIYNCVFYDPLEQVVN